MPAHEADLEPTGGGPPPDVVRDWLVHWVMFERCGATDPGNVAVLDRMRAWEDEGSGGDYLLDVSPA